MRLGGGTAQGVNLHLWSTYCVPDTVPGFGDSAKVSALVDLYNILVEEDREETREVIRK